MIAAVYPATLPSKQDRDGVINVWATLLGDMPYEVANKAVLLALNTCDYPPKPKDIRNAAKDLYGVHNPTAAEAWLMVTQAIRHGTPLNELNPTVHKAIDVVGYTTICMSSEGNTFTQSHFMKVYEEILKHEQLKENVVAIGAWEMPLLDSKTKLLE